MAPSRPGVLALDENAISRPIVEGKATSQCNRIFEAQTLTHLRLAGLKLGPVINFGERAVKNGIHSRPTAGGGAYTR